MKRYSFFLTIVAEDSENPTMTVDMLLAKAFGQDTPWLRDSPILSVRDHPEDDET